MEYAVPIENTPQQTWESAQKDFNFIRFVGYDNPGSQDACYRQFFSSENITALSNKVTELTKGVHPDNKSILVPREWVIDTMNSVYDDFDGGEVGAPIGSRYIIPNEQSQDFVNMWNDRTITILVEHIRNTYGMIECNQKLTAWTTVLGEFNEHGIRRHSPIKTLEKRPAPFQFNMNY